MSDQTTTIRFNKILSETDKAYYLDCEGDHKWMPKSQVTVDEKKKTVTMPDWLFAKSFPDE